MNDVRHQDDGLGNWVERINKAVEYTGSNDHEDVRSILKDYKASIKLPTYNSKKSRSYFQPNSNPQKAHKNGYRLAIREVRATLKGDSDDPR